MKTQSREKGKGKIMGFDVIRLVSRGPFFAKWIMTTTTIESKPA